MAATCLKFGGDALLILFAGPAHTERAAAACWSMRELVERPWTTPLVPRVTLGISQGIHSGDFGLHLVDAGHEELWVVGPGHDRDRAGARTPQQRGTDPPQP